MDDSSDNIIVDTATRIFRDLCAPATINDAENGVWPKALWDALEESGLPLAWVAGRFRRRRGDNGGRVCGIARGGTLRGSGAARRNSDGGLAAGACRDQGAGRTDDDRPGACRRSYHARRHDEKLGGRARRVPFARDAGHIAVLAHRGDERVVALVADVGIADFAGQEPRRRAARYRVVRRRWSPRRSNPRRSTKT